MNQLTKGLLVVMTTLALAAVMLPKAHAGTEEELNKLLDGMPVIYAGTCWFDGKGVLTFKKEVMKVTVPCIVGMKLPDTTKHYVVVLLPDGEPQALVMYDEAAQKQERLWVADPKKPAKGKEV